ncbi:ABC transporter permease subunit [Microbacterium sp. VKM Ac-2870]|uniref:ABC transporter permease subunit n=1 Tax=Microbacterium sp. VKM Ac-2870 TaxID=2783825 RepID=UPI00188A6578|nr:ABC transporter permease subunit [Microbacterium sp. VKM Ac-2870]MBF4560769.1 ABC transporter permease subunit [Microbacterium sp. VKM Ac-2870]
MSTATVSVPSTDAVSGLAASPYRLSFVRVVRSEWLKLLSLRSTWWSLAITVALSVGISLLMAAAMRDFESGITPVMVIVMPMQFTMLVAGILGAIAITGEYSTGMIRSTLTAEPRRGAVLAAKSIVVTVLLALATAVTYAIAVLVTAPILKTGIDWSDAAQSWTPLLAGVFAMATFALIGLGFGFIIRNGAGAIAATVGVLFVLPIVLSMFSFAGEGWRWLVDSTQYLPMSGAQAATAVDGDHIVRGLVTLAAWPAALLIGAWVSLRSRDA